MLGGQQSSFRRSRQQSPAGSASLASSGGVEEEWRSFCRDEGRRAAVGFMEKARAYLQSSGARVPEAALIREFATSLMETLARPPSSSSSDLLRSLSPPDSLSSPSSSRKTLNGSKHWWKIFKRNKGDRGGGGLGRRDSMKRGAVRPDNDPGILLDGILHQMNFVKDTPTWERCRLLLIDRHGNHQLEVYLPPKSCIPKMSLFCFLIEEVRSTSLLEVPDCDTSFVIMSRSHGEYVFNAESQHEKNIWMSTILQYTSTTHHIPMSASLSALSASHRSSGRNFTRSRSNSGIMPSLARTPPPPPPTSNGEEPVMVDIVLLDTPTGDSPPVAGEPPPVTREDSAPSTRRRVRSMCLDTPPLQLLEDHTPIPSDLNSHSNNKEVSGAHSLATPSPPPVPLHRKSSAPPTVLNGMCNGDTKPSFNLYSSSEALGCVDSEERFNVPGVERGGHSRRRSYDSNYSHSTDVGGGVERGMASPLVRNSYRIDVGSNERISSIATSGPSSTFSSAGNLHDVTREVTHSPSSNLTTTPDPLANLETTSQVSSSNALFIETTNTTVDLPRHTDHPYQSWATTSTDVENLRVLSQYPWFHGMISRNNATQLVQVGGVSGKYLMRQSESREGDFVLTFNCHNRAKHLRLTLDSTGCTIQHLWFEDTSTMIDYFKTHPIPLDSVPATEDVVLTSYVDRSASDSFRTTTIINMERITRTPPRRSRSIHVTSSLGTSPDRSNSPIRSSRNRSSNWRQIFNRSASSQSVRSHATVQRSHSANASSLQEIRGRNGTGGGSGRWGNRVSENNYVSRNY